MSETASQAVPSPLAPVRRLSAVSFALLLTSSVWGIASTTQAGEPADFTGAAPRSAAEVAAMLDVFAAGHLEAMGAEAAPLIGDETFLRRVSLDLTGVPPTPEELIMFTLDPSDDKRSKLVQSLLASDAYSANWARYWRDVIFSRATDQRTRRFQPVFEKWITEQLAENKSWDAIVTDLLTATGDVEVDGSTSLIMVHAGDPAEVAAEASRIFLGIQIQCANCHDHPTDQWKRSDFHQLAAYFTRIQFRQAMKDDRRTFVVASFENRRGPRGRGNATENADRIVRTFDRNQDGRISKTEVGDSPFSQFFERLVQLVDSDKDGMLTAAEIKTLPPMPQRPGQGSEEYYMPDLSDPSSKGTPIDPVFFVNAEAAPQGLEDLERRTLLAVTMTAPDNPWFARAFVNRMWSELTGSGFYMPIDDMGPERVAYAEDMLDLLSAQFVAHNYDIKWLLQTIALTQTYQRGMSDQSEAMFAADSPTRLRADALFESLQNAIGPPPNPRFAAGRRGPGMMAPNMMRGPLGYFRSPRFQFTQLFEFDPSTPQADVMGTIPQALFMMNSPLIENSIQALRGGKLTRILRQFDKNDDVTRELYLTVLSRQPTESELKLARDYVKEVENRREAFEDLYWALLNSSEFLTNR